MAKFIEVIPVKYGMDKPNQMASNFKIGRSPITRGQTFL